MKQRITISEVLENEWFKKGYKPPIFEQHDVSLDDVDAIFDELAVRFTVILFSDVDFSCFLQVSLLLFRIPI